MLGPDIDFQKIRPHGHPATRPSAFEELASVLIKDGIVEWPTGTKFDRFGDPDGGREGRGELLNGDIWAWQAKYLFKFDASEATQVSKSIKRALETEPNLKRYFVILPIDLPAGDTKGLKSAHTKWIENVDQWKQLARERQMEVSFQFVGESDLLTSLTDHRHDGRARYWFQTDILTPEWQRRRLEEAIAKSGPRYSPQVHVEVEANQVLAAVGREPTYRERWQEALAELRSSRRWGWRSPQGVAQLFDAALDQSSVVLNSAESYLEKAIDLAGSTGSIPEIGRVLDDATAGVQVVESLLQAHCRSDDGHFVGDAAPLYSTIHNALDALSQAQALAGSTLAKAASSKRLLLTGRGGTGKTHLLCDSAAKRIAAGRPTLLLLGSDFDARSLLNQIAELTQLGGGTESVVSGLDAASEAAGCVGLIMIDALNESEGAHRWSDALRGLTTVGSNGHCTRGLQRSVRRLIEGRIGGVAGR